ncbi:MAG: hypothetical protein ACYDH6_03860 [Acidimicrobiales bacterium]
MAGTPSRLSRPSTGVFVMLIAVAVFALILFAAYHGSGGSSSSRCGATSGMLRRVAADVAAASGGSPSGRQVAALQRDDDDVNNYLNGNQHPDPGFNARLLPVAENLGRLVTDLSDRVPSGADGSALGAALASVSRYCGFP